MEYKSVSTKLSRDEVTQLRAFCKKKGVTPSSFIREIILHEIEIPIPHNIAGRNGINYDRENDRFSWFVKLDNGECVYIMRTISPEFLENLDIIINSALGERNTYIQKNSDISVPIPSTLVRGE